MLAIALFVVSGGSAYAAAPRPNIVLCIADDWGWPHAMPTAMRWSKRRPSIAWREGVLFANAFVSSPSCTPSRGALITGQHFWRLDEGANLHSVWPAGRFAEYPQLLADAGYHRRHVSQGLGARSRQPRLET